MRQIPFFPAHRFVSDTYAKRVEGFLCLESEGAPIHFRGLRLRVLT